MQSVLEMDVDLKKPDVGIARERSRVQTGIKDEEGNQLSMNSRLTELGRAGLATELFFRTMRYCIIAFAILSAIGSIPLAYNVQLNAGVYSSLSVVATTIGRCCQHDWRLILYFQVTIRSSHSAPVSPHAIPWFFIVIVMVTFLYVLRYKQRAIAEYNDKNFLTASDFSVRLRAIPLDHSTEEELALFATEHGGTVAHVAVGWKCAEYIVFLNQWKQKQWKQKQIEWRECKQERVDAGKLATLTNGKVEVLQKELLELESEMFKNKAVGAGGEATGTAFITFETGDSKMEFMEVHARSW
ncbi:hypothetical protein T492DRAFT_835734 [Pavlovales sp. CCMP2436]|nr:hypothetical protein T492DRAFT_835734 [Pavlovales sp. CCMP2436]